MWWVRLQLVLLAAAGYHLPFFNLFGNSRSPFIGEPCFLLQNPLGDILYYLFDIIIWNNVLRSIYIYTPKVTEEREYGYHKYKPQSSVMAEVLSSSSSTVTKTTSLVLNLNYYTPNESNQRGENKKYTYPFFGGAISFAHSSSLLRLTSPPLVLLFFFFSMGEVGSMGTGVASSYLLAVGIFDGRRSARCLLLISLATDASIAAGKAGSPLAISVITPSIKVWYYLHTSVPSRFTLIFHSFFFSLINRKMFSWVRFLWNPHEKGNSLDLQL